MIAVDRTYKRVAVLAFAFLRFSNAGATDAHLVASWLPTCDLDSRPAEYFSIAMNSAGHIAFTGGNSVRARGLTELDIAPSTAKSLRRLARASALSTAQVRELQEDDNPILYCIRLERLERGPRYIPVRLKDAWIGGTTFERAITEHVDMKRLLCPMRIDTLERAAYCDSYVIGLVIHELENCGHPYELRVYKDGAVHLFSEFVPNSDRYFAISPQQLGQLQELAAPFVEEIVISELGARSSMPREATPQARARYRNFTSSAEVEKMRALIFQQIGPPELIQSPGAACPLAPSQYPRGSVTVLSNED